MGHAGCSHKSPLQCGRWIAHHQRAAHPFQIFSLKIGQHSPGRPTGRLGATAQLCNPRTLCCEAFELLRLRPGPVQPSLGPKSARPAPSLQWAHQSNLGRASAQRCPALEPGGANPFCAAAVPPRGWSFRAVPTRPGHWFAMHRERTIAHGRRERKEKQH